MQRAAQTQTLDFVFLSRVSCRSQCARSYRSEDLQSRSIRRREKKKKKKKMNFQIVADKIFLIKKKKKKKEETRLPIFIYREL